MSVITGERKKKVAYLLTPIDFGGSEKVSLNFLKNFDTIKFEIVPILLIRPWEETKAFEQEVRNIRLKYHIIPVAVKPQEKGKDYFRIIRCYKRLYSILKQGDFHLIHSNGYFANILSVPLAKWFRIAHVATCHGFIDNDNKLILYNALDKFILRFSSKIISVSENINDQLLNSGVSMSKIALIVNAVELPNHRGQIGKSDYDTDSMLTVGYVGRLSKEKGLKFLLEAGTRLREASLLFKIILVGDGPERQSLAGLVDLLGLKQHVVFTGFQANPEEMLLLFDLFVLPSLTEGTPMALLEAMSYGLPAIASGVGGIPDVISHNVEGLIVEPGDSRALAESILQLSHDWALREKMSENARQRVEDNYSIAPWCNRIETLYLSLIGGQS